MTDDEEGWRMSALGPMEATTSQTPQSPLGEVANAMLGVLHDTEGAGDVRAMVLLMKPDGEGTIGSCGYPEPGSAEEMIADLVVHMNAVAETIGRTVLFGRGT